MPRPLSIQVVLARSTSRPKSNALKYRTFGVVYKNLKTRLVTHIKSFLFVELH